MKALSRRLEVIASLIPQGAKVCDVGTDHGYLPIYLLKSGKASKVIATDIRLKPLNTAKSNIEKFGVGNIELRLCDGLEAVSSTEADTVIIAGMGGEVISGIIERCVWAKDTHKTFILQPMTSPEILRSFLFSSGFEILFEKPLEDNGKIYSVITAVFSGKPYRYKAYELFTGKISADTDEGFKYIKKQYNRCSECAESLKSITSKTEEYTYYQSISDALNELLQEKK